MAAAMLLSACAAPQKTQETVPAETAAPATTEAQETAAPEAVPGETVPANYTAKKKTTLEYFGTASMLCMYGDFTAEGETKRAEATWTKIKEMLSSLDNLLSTTIPDSEISRFNALKYGESMAISPVTAEVWQLSMGLYARTNGIFNPAMYPLIDLWAFSPRYIYSSEKVEAYDRERADGAFALPDEAYIDAFLKLADPENILLSGSDAEGWTLTKNVPAVTVNGVTYEAKIDLGGIVKGYATDLAERLLREDGWPYAYFSCGTSSMCMLKSASANAIKKNVPDYVLGIRAPRENESGLYASVAIRDESLSSSGDYENNYSLDGQLYCHIIDPRTGRPLNVGEARPQRGISTVTLMSGSATEDDALTTALCLMGPEEAIRFFNAELKGRDMLMVLYSADSDTYEVVTNLGADRMSLMEEAYVLASETDAEGNIRYTGKLFPELSKEN